nr:unnamed protein product [Digitaria exilis]
MLPRRSDRSIEDCSSSLPHLAPSSSAPSLLVVAQEVLDPLERPSIGGRLSSLPHLAPSSSAPSFCLPPSVALFWASNGLARPRDLAPYFTSIPRSYFARAQRIVVLSTKSYNA